MSNPLYLAQTAQPQAHIAIILLGAAVLCGAIFSAYLIVRRRWYELPPVPDGPMDPGAAILGAAIAMAVAMYVSLLSVAAGMLGLDEQSLKTPEGMRRMTLITPAVQLLTAGLVLAMVRPYLPRAMHWSQQRAPYLRQAFTGYLLALPWVFVIGAIVQLIVHTFDLEAKSQHMLFEIWSGDRPGITPFKLVAMLSAVVGAPLVEELVFRGLLQRLFHRLTGNGVLAIVGASLAFTATHAPWTTQPPIFVLSLFLGWLYFRSGTILAPILMHAIFNGFQFVLFLTMTGGEAIPTP